jgi:hypothetical protein
MRPRAFDRNCFAVRQPRAFGTSIFSAPERYFPVIEFSFSRFLRRSVATTSPPCVPRKRSQINHVIGFFDGFFVVFDDQNRVSQIAQLLQSFEQFLIVARMQDRLKARPKHTKRRAIASRFASPDECADLRRRTKLRSAVER